MADKGSVLKPDTVEHKGKTTKLTRADKRELNKAGHRETQEAAPGTKEHLMRVFEAENNARKEEFYLQMENGTLTAEDRFEEVIARIGDEGMSSLEACIGVMSRSRFYELMEEDGKEGEQRADKYARAKANRAELYFYLMEKVAFNREQDHTPFTGLNVVKRDEMIVKTLQWMLERMNHRKYGVKPELDEDLKESVEIHLNLGPGNDVDEPA